MGRRRAPHASTPWRAPPASSPTRPASRCPPGKSFIIVQGGQDRQGAPLLGREAVAGAGHLQVQRLRQRCSRWSSAIFEVGGKGHSVGIASFDDDHIHRLASMAPVSRIMVRQPNVRGNAGSFTNGMPQTASLGCGTWGGNITSENISVKHYMNTTWVSRPIPEDKPTSRSCSASSTARRFSSSTPRPPPPAGRFAPESRSADRKNASCGSGRPSERPTTTRGRCSSTIHRQPTSGRPRCLTPHRPRSMVRRR